MRLALAIATLAVAQSAAAQTVVPPVKPANRAEATSLRVPAPPGDAPWRCFTSPSTAPAGRWA
jgi:hypothetical protein